MSDKYNILFTPFNIGKQQIKNRFIMGPMGCNQMYDSYGALNNDGIAYYTERAKGGFGAVFLGVAMVDNLVETRCMHRADTRKWPVCWWSAAAHTARKCSAKWVWAVAVTPAGPLLLLQ